MKTGRRTFSIAKESEPNDPWEKQVERAKYGSLSKQVVFLAGAAQWVATAGTDALIRHPSALREYDYRAVCLGQWVAAWLLTPDGDKVLSQVNRLRDFATQQKINIAEIFQPLVPGEPIFGNVAHLRETGECERLDIPVTIEIPPIDNVEYQILWRSWLIRKSRPQHLFSVDEVMKWLPSVSRRTIEKAMKALSVPRLKKKVGRKLGSKDSPTTPRQLFKSSK